MNATSMQDDNQYPTADPAQYSRRSTGSGPSPQLKRRKIDEKDSEESWPQDLQGHWVPASAANELESILGQDSKDEHVSPFLPDHSVEPADFIQRSTAEENGLFDMGWLNEDYNLQYLLPSTAGPVPSSLNGAASIEDIFLDDYLFGQGQGEGPDFVSKNDLFPLSSPENTFLLTQSTGLPIPQDTTPETSIPASTISTQSPTLDIVTGVPPTDEQWAFLLSRPPASSDPSTANANTPFFFAVTTTKIFCRPSCAARRPARKNVLIFISPLLSAAASAQAAGYRACKRCRPEVPDGAVERGVKGVMEVLEMIVSDANGSLPTSSKNPDGSHASNENETKWQLDTLSQKAGLSPFHFHRLFKSVTLLTPGEMMAASRALALGDSLGLNAANANESCDACGLNETTGLTEPFRPTSELLTDRAKRVGGGWKPRTAKKALGGVSPWEYAAGLCEHVVEGYVFEMPQTDTETSVMKDAAGEGQFSVGVAISLGKRQIASQGQTTTETETDNKDKVTDGILTVLTGPDPVEVSRRLRTRFPGITLIETNVEAGLVVHQQAFSQRVKVAVIAATMGMEVGESTMRLRQWGRWEWMVRCRVWVALVKG